jgi:serine/threonine-protein phosphatase 6 regulatory subunit 3
MIIIHLNAGRLSKPENLRKLLGWLVKAPEDVDESLRYKLPYIACEVLCCEAPPLIGALTETTEVLDIAWSILDRDPPLNPIQASYFAKVMGMLLLRETDKVSLVIFAVSCVSDARIYPEP